MLFSPNDYGAKFRLVPEKDFADVPTDRPEKGPVSVKRGEDLYQKQGRFWDLSSIRPQ